MKPAIIHRPRQSMSYTLPPRDTLLPGVSVVFATAWARKFEISNQMIGAERDWAGHMEEQLNRLRRLSRSKKRSSGCTREAGHNRRLHQTPRAL